MSSPSGVRGKVPAANALSAYTRPQNASRRKKKIIHFQLSSATWTILMSLSSSTGGNCPDCPLATPLLLLDTETEVWRPSCVLCLVVRCRTCSYQARCVCWPTVESSSLQRNADEAQIYLKHFTSMCKNYRIAKHKAQTRRLTAITQRPDRYFSSLSDKWRD